MNSSKLIISIFLVFAIVSTSLAQTKGKVDKKQLANQVRSEFLHA